MSQRRTASPPEGWTKQPLEGLLTKRGPLGPLTKGGPLGPITKGERPAKTPSPQRLAAIRRNNGGNATFYAQQLITALEADGWPNQSSTFAYAMDRLSHLWLASRDRGRA
jgi:hypothetical protein